MHAILLGHFGTGLFDACSYMCCPILELVVDCGQPEEIVFGSVDTISTTVNSVAVYTCENGYRLVGASVRTCLSSGVWSATPPICASKR